MTTPVKAATTKAMILQTAVKIASVHGIEGLTLGELAKAVGMSKSGLFAHFAAKDQLQLEVLQKATENFVDVVLRPSFKAPRGEPRLVEMSKNWFNYLNGEANQPGGSILIAASSELDDQPGVLRDYLQKVQNDLVANIVKAAKMAVDEGQFRKDLDADQFAWSMYSFVLGYHHFKRMLNSPKAETYYKQSMKHLMEIARDASISGGGGITSKKKTKTSASSKKKRKK